MSSSSMEHTLPSKLEKNGTVSSLDDEPHADLIAELKGQVMHVPDMLSLFPSWPSGGRNKYYKRLKIKLDRISERLATLSSRAGSVEG